MKTPEIIRRRMGGQRLGVPGPATATEVVQLQGAVQAQDFAGAVWALSQRTRTRLTQSAIEAEIDSGQILRTHVLRPTWHFVTPADIRWMLALTGPRVRQQMASYNRKFGLTGDVFRRSFKIIERRLGEGGSATRAELRSALERSGIAVGPGQRLGHLMMEAELDALICSGPRRGSQSTYALLDDRAPQPTRYDRDESLGTLARRYFATRSPATVHDFSWWSGLTVGDARRAIAIASHLRECTTEEGRSYWIDDSVDLPRRKATAHLLPNYDEYFIGYRDRSAIGGRIGNIAAVTGGNALIAHVAFIDGLLVGGWKRLVEPDQVVVDLVPVTRLTVTERGRLKRECAGYSAFLGRPVELRCRS